MSSVMANSAISSIATTLTARKRNSATNQRLPAPGAPRLPAIRLRCRMARSATARSSAIASASVPVPRTASTADGIASIDEHPAMATATTT